MSRKIGDFLAWLGGGDAEILAQAPWERTKFTQMAGVLLTTAGLAVASMSFALHDGMKAPWFWSVLFGVLWGIVIINLDRLLVLSMGSVREKRRLLLLAAPRLAIACLLAIVISTPLVLRIFASDIDHQIYKTQQQQSEEQKKQAADTAEQDQANQLKKQIDEDRSILAGNLPQDFSSPDLDAARSKLESVQKRQQDAVKKRDDALLAWKCERYGQGERCHNASNKQGQGQLADAKKKIYDEAASEAAVLTGQLKDAQAAVDKAREGVKGDQAQQLKKAQAAAAAELPGLQKKYDDLTAELRNRSALGTRLIESDNKLPAQIRALYDIGDQDATLLFAHLAVFLLFFMIEVLPVMVKILLNLGDVSSYESAVKQREAAAIESVRAKRVAARQRAEGLARRDAEVEEDMRRREVDLGKRANEHVAAEMTAIIDVALRQWSAQLHAQLAAAAGAPVPVPGTPANAAVPPATPPAPPAHVQGIAPLHAAQPGGAPAAAAMPPTPAPATPTPPAPARTPPAALTNGAPLAPMPAQAPAGSTAVPTGAADPLGHTDGESGAGLNGGNRAAMGQVVSPINLPDDDNL